MPIFKLVIAIIKKLDFYYGNVPDNIMNFKHWSGVKNDWIVLNGRDLFQSSFEMAPPILVIDLKIFRFCWWRLGG